MRVWGVLTVQCLHMLRAVEGAGQGSHTSVKRGGSSDCSLLVGTDRVSLGKQEGTAEGGEEGLAKGCGGEEVWDVGVWR